MRFIKKIFASLVGNSLGLALAASFVPKVHIAGGVFEWAMVIGALTLLHLFLRPIIKLLFGPFIILTLGLGLIAINAALLYLLDTVSGTLTIDGILTLFTLTMIISIMNMVAYATVK